MPPLVYTGHVLPQAGTQHRAYGQSSGAPNDGGLFNSFSSASPASPAGNDKYYKMKESPQALDEGGLLGETIVKGKYMSCWRVFICGFFPTMLGGFGFYCQSVGLHYATYSYVHKYAITDNQVDEYKECLTLKDPVQDQLEFREEKVALLDSLAELLPAVFGAIVASLAFFAPRGLKKKVLVLWTKVMICIFFLFFLKGFIGACTTVPDSRGWATCQSQSLVPEAVDWMREEHVFWEFLILDFWWAKLYGKPMRYCADMMFSGHTFVVTAFALGLYELFRILQVQAREKQASHLKAWWAIIKIAVLTLIGLATIVQQCLEIYTVEISHFHYTSDVIVSFIMTFLLYSNGAICIAAETWVRICKEASLEYCRSLFGMSKSPSAKAVECAAFENLLGDFHWKEYADIEKVFHENHHFKEEIDKWVWRAMDSKADVFIPPCCFPCCCMSGRHHVYTDDGLKTLLKQHALMKAEVDMQPSQRPPLHYDMEKRALEKAAWLYCYMDHQMREARNYRDGVTMREILQTFMLGKKSSN